GAAPPPNGAGDRGAGSKRLDNDDRGDPVEADAAVFFGDVRPEEAKFAASLYQRAQKRPVLLLQLVDGRRQFLLEKRSSRPPDEPLVVAERFGREDPARLGIVDE